MVLFSQLSLFFQSSSRATGNIFLNLNNWQFKKQFYYFLGHFRLHVSPTKLKNLKYTLSWEKMEHLWNPASLRLKRLGCYGWAWFSCEKFLVSWNLKATRKLIFWYILHNSETNLQGKFNVDIALEIKQPKRIWLNSWQPET